jgi:hypothetical protein
MGVSHPRQRPAQGRRYETTAGASRYDEEHPMTTDPETVDLTPTVDEPAPEPAATEPPAPTDLATVRDLILRAHPDIVPELLAGETVDALLASVEPARAAWQRLAERIGATPSVPAGGQKPVAVDPALLSAGEKIRRGLARGGR